MILINKKIIYFLVTILIFLGPTISLAQQSCANGEECPDGQVCDLTTNPNICVSVQTVGGGGTVSGDTDVGGGNAGYKLLAPIGGFQNIPLGTGGFATYINILFNIGIGIAIALSVIMIVIGGAQYLSTDAVFGKEEGRSKLTNAVWGLILALGIYIILNTINPNLLNLNLTLEGTRPTGPGAGPGTGAGTTTCSIQPLSALTDTTAQQMEVGGSSSIIWQGTHPKLKCAANRLIFLNGGGFITSAYRPQSYQTHLYEIKDKWCNQGLRTNTSPACTSVKSSIFQEVSKHFGASWNCGAVAQENSTHSSGIGVDISGITNPALASQACLIWKNYSGDPFHYDLNTTCAELLTCPQ